MISYLDEREKIVKKCYEDGPLSLLSTMLAHPCELRRSGRVGRLGDSSATPMSKCVQKAETGAFRAGMRLWVRRVQRDGP